MNKKIMMLALALIGVAAFMLPASAMAAEEDIPLHAVPRPVGTKTISGGTGEMSTVGGLSLHSNGLEGTATAETSTTGTTQLKFSEVSGFGFPCTTPGQASGVVTTSVLPFHLVTLPENKPGVLATPPANGIFAEFVCGGFLKSVVKGNGLIGTITLPACGGSSTTGTLALDGTKGVQAHKKVAGTATEYHLTASLNGGKEEEEAATVCEGTIAFKESIKLECT